MGTNVTTAFITCPANEQETLGIKLPFLVMIIKNVRLLSSSSRNTSPLKFKFSMTKTFAGDLELRTINPQQESSLLFVPCLWGSMKAGIRFSSTYQILLAEHTAAITSKLSASQSTLTAGFVVFISLIVCTPKKNFLQNSSFSYQSRNSSEWFNTVFIVIAIWKSKVCYHWRQSLGFRLVFSFLPKIDSELPEFLSI